MSQRINIEIKDKIATCLTQLPIVCGNADYVVDFVFDEEWNAHNIKTALFVVNGKVTPQVFEGNVCPVPVIQNTLIAWVGVFAGTVDDGTLSTSTPALVKCIPCITDGDNVPMPPPDDVYNQIIELLNEYIESGGSGGTGGVTTAKVKEIVAEATKDFVKNTDYGGSTTPGVVAANYANGIGVTDGHLFIYGAEKFNIEARKTSRPITPINLDYAVKVGVTGNAEPLTEDEQKAVCEWINAVQRDNTNTGLFRVYGTDANGNPKMWEIASSDGVSIAGKLVFLRSPKDTGKVEPLGTFACATPQNPYSVANMKYVDDRAVDSVEAEVDENNELTIEVKDRNGNVIATTSVTLPSGGGGAVDLSNYIQFDDVPSTTKAGPIKLPTLNYGIEYVASNGALRIKNSNNASKISGRANYSYEAVTLNAIDAYGVAVLTDPKITMTAEEQAKAQAWLGVTDLIASLVARIEALENK